ncbi:hypothetical protein P691DRAFT_75041 [Macrolepiota fuliginosa MF-IS2]|uniref:Uncharacterized protein n=1 Tax=Macrolepiota fuliginosa MF-IS2 TaxID=1400762 RepID=A0A9P5WZQ9_9AGAR|nr:hypothetical protein P691DRAFT_75041 [Macrolepiota fuliginosa MF-IS2]
MTTLPMHMHDLRTVPLTLDLANRRPGSRGARGRSEFVMSPVGDTQGYGSMGQAFPESQTAPGGHSVYGYGSPPLQGGPIMQLVQGMGPHYAQGANDIAGSMYFRVFLSWRMVRLDLGLVLGVRWVEPLWGRSSINNHSNHHNYNHNHSSSKNWRNGTAQVRVSG